MGTYDFAPDATSKTSLASSWVSSGKHTFKLVAVAGEQGPRIDVDAFAVLS